MFPPAHTPVSWHSFWPATCTSRPVELLDGCVKVPNGYLSLLLSSCNWQKTIADRINMRSWVSAWQLTRHQSTVARHVPSKITARQRTSPPFQESEVRKCEQIAAVGATSPISLVSHQVNLRPCKCGSTQVACS